jgi:potassium-transporting ATPase ATP-binding subunit
MHAARSALVQGPILRDALWASVTKLAPQTLLRNPVIFVVWIGAALSSVILLGEIVTGAAQWTFTLQLVLWLWFTVLFANFAEAVAEGRGKAQADSLREARTLTHARRLDASDLGGPIDKLRFSIVDATTLRKGDLVLCVPGDIIPSDGEVVEGVASVDESAITGESAPVIRESGGDRSSVTGGTKVLSDHLVIRVTADPGETFLDRMIALVEGASRRKTPNEIALTILLSGLSLIFLLAVVTLQPLALYSGGDIAVPVLVALLVCLIPTTIGGLLSAIGIAGMDRLIRQNVIAVSGRAVEAAGDINTLLLDKTGTITLGNRQAVAFLPMPGVEEALLAERAESASLADETPEGRSIVVLANERLAGRTRTLTGAEGQPDATFVPFTAQTRTSGVTLGALDVRKGAADAIERWVVEQGGRVPDALAPTVNKVARGGGTPLVVAVRDGGAVAVLGVVHLKDIVKAGMRERFDRLRAMGIRTVMITGDNPLTAAAIAAESGVDEFLAEARPEDKMALIKREQAGGRLVAMTGDGTNDAPALAQADVGVAMNSGTPAAKEAGNMVDLDSDPTKLIEIVEIGKQLLMTRGALTTFSIANDVAKYFAIVPAIFLTTYPALGALNVMGLHSPESAILSSVIFNALIIIVLIPLALRGVTYRPQGAAALLRRNLLAYGVGGLVVPFISIAAIDRLLVLIGIV